MYVFIFTFVYVNAVPTEVREGVGSPGAIGSCEQSDVGAGNKTQVLRKSMGTHPSLKYLFWAQ